MLKINDHGCNKHNQSQLTLFGSEAELMKDILYNLPRKGGFHTFICEHGHTHHVSFQFKAEKVASDYAHPTVLSPERFETGHDVLPIN